MNTLSIPRVFKITRHIEDTIEENLKRRADATVTLGA